MPKLKAPFPYFGGKSKIADLVWSRFGDVPNYVEPFAGSLAVLLARPTEPKVETVNDKDAMIANFWRALKNDPEGVAQWADWPVNEADLYARHRWLINQDEFRERMMTDPDYYDVKIAGWWVWGISCWIGQGWCRGKISKQLPDLGNTGRGVHRSSINNIYEYFQALAHRLRRVRVCCGDWKRVLTRAVTIGHGLTAVFLDPPYSHNLRDTNLYSIDEDISAEVRAWAIEHGNNPLFRIAVCGYEGEHEFPDTWEKVEWKAGGGYSNTGDARGKENRFKERIWFSPHCLKVYPMASPKTLAKTQNLKN